MAKPKKRGRLQKNAAKEEEEINGDNVKEESSGYEQFRDQRIKENMDRMQRLGIIDLASKLKSSPKRIKKNSSEKKPSLPSSDPPRRSSRLQSVPQVSYYEKHIPKEKEMRQENVQISIKEGLKLEIYTEEEERLLGDCKAAWTLCVDGYSEDGERIYDPFYGKSCHQCRQKTLGHRTSCSKCKSVQGQFCGDCLYTRYGENVLEANQEPNWICPVCRGICNCSRCRRVKGWEPTGQLYNKVIKLGFKSVAHYLIKTRQANSNLKEEAAESPLDAQISSSTDTEIKPPLEIEVIDRDVSPDGTPKPASESEHNDEVEDVKYSDDDFNEEDDDNHDSDFDDDGGNDD